MLVNIELGQNRPADAQLPTIRLAQPGDRTRPKLSPNPTEPTLKVVGKVEVEVGNMGTRLLGVGHRCIKQLTRREENSFIDTGTRDLLTILARRHFSKSYDKGKNRCQ